MKTMPVVATAMVRISLRFSPGASIMITAPSSGRKVIRVKRGLFMFA